MGASKMLTELQAAGKWDIMTYNQRVALLRNSCTTMKDEHWQPLIMRMAAQKFHDLTIIQRNVLQEYLVGV
jgi:hypothetical protein